MGDRKVILYWICHCDIIGKSIQDLIPSSLFSKYEFVESKRPDHVFYNVTDCPGIYTNYPNAIKIFISGEPVSPVFIFFDYCVGMGNISFGDRYYCYLGFTRTCLSIEPNIQMDIKDLDAFVSEKGGFIDYVQSHDRPDKLREKWVNVFQTYKAVDCPGPHLHNLGEDVSSYAKKIALQSKYKFFLIIEASDHPYCITKKITHAFIAGSMPVYYETKDLDKAVNPKAFVSLIGKTESEAIEAVKQLDDGDTAYKAMLQEPIFANHNFVDNCIKRYESFLDNIFGQNKENAFRREHWYYEERMHKSFRKATLVLHTKDRISTFKNEAIKK